MTPLLVDIELPPELLAVIDGKTMQELL